MKPIPPPRRDFWALLALVMLCLVVYGRCVTFEHTLYDDPNIIFENPKVMAGLTWDSIRWALLNPNFGLYMPLPTLTFMLDRNLFGDWAGGYHGSTLLWHILCVCSFYWVMRRLLGNFEAVFAASLLVAVHPVQAMTVNWISARNEIMPALFMLWSVDMYQRAATRTPSSSFVSLLSSRSAFLSLLFMFLGIMSKQGIVALPVVLLLLDYWPLNRIALSTAQPLATLRRMATLTLEKAPWFALSGLGVFFAIYGKRDFGAFQGETLLSPLNNIGFAFTAYARYLGHLVWPERYIMAYSVSGPPPAWWFIGASALLMTGVTGFALWQTWRRPWLVVCWGWFVLFLLPVSGLVRYAAESIALRYLYAPGMGLYLLVAFGLYGLLRGGNDTVPKHTLSGKGKQTPPPSIPDRAYVFWMATLVLTVVCGALAFRQSGFWQNSETLAQRALVVTRGENALAHNHLAVLRERQGLRQQAHAHVREAVRIEPERLMWQINYGNSLLRHLRYSETLEVAAPLLEKHPDNISVLNLYGGALTGLGRFTEGRPHLERAVAIEPDYVPALFNLALGYHHQGDAGRARPLLERVLSVQPTHGGAKALLAEMGGD